LPRHQGRENTPRERFEEGLRRVVRESKQPREGRETMTSEQIREAIHPVEYKDGET
jgi:hypothetical protein